MRASIVSITLLILLSASCTNVLVSETPPSHIPAPTAFLPLRTSTRPVTPTTKSPESLTPSEAPRSRQRYVDMTDAPERPPTVNGALVLDQEGNGLLFCLDTLATAPLPPVGVNLPEYSAQLASLDGTRFSYLGPEMDPDGLLYVVEADGKVREASNWSTGGLWQLIGWLDGTSLALKRYTDLDGTIFRYDFVNAALTIIHPSFPTTSANGDLAITDIDAHTPFPLYDPGLSRVIVKRLRSGDRPTGAFELWDANSGEMLLQFNGFLRNRPVWAPDGSVFAASAEFDPDPEGLERTQTLLVFDREGIELSRVERFYGPLTWSHDGRWIAGGTPLHISCTDSCPIGVSLYSASDRETVIYEVQSAGAGSLDQFPVWSPDSSMLAVNSGLLRDDGHLPDPVEVIILDLMNQIAWRIPIQARVLGWLAKCP